MKKLISLTLAAVMLFTVALADTTETTVNETVITVAAGLNETAAPTIPDGTLSAEVVSFTADQMYAVYSAPDSKSLRGAHGKAKVSTNDWIQVFGSEGDWLLVQYDITEKHYRIGYIYKNALPDGVTVQELSLTAVSAVTAKTVTVTDDPLKSGSALASLDENAEVTVLGTMGEWSYIEATVDGTRLRGFVPSDSLSDMVTSVIEARAALIGTWSLFAGNSIMANQITFCDDGTMTGVLTADDGTESSWEGNWSLRSIDASSVKYWNDPEFELLIQKNGASFSFGLRVCRQHSTDKTGYALILSDTETSGSAAMCE